MSRKVSSPTVKAEILGWKLDVAYSLGMSFAFFIAVKFQNTPLAFLSPYFDQIIAILIMDADKNLSGIISFFTRSGNC